MRPHRPSESLEATNGEEQSSKEPSEVFSELPEEGTASSRRRHCVLATPLPASETPAKVAEKLPFFEASGGSSTGAGTSGGSVSTTKERDDGDGDELEPLCEGSGEVLPTESVATTANW